MIDLEIIEKISLMAVSGFPDKDLTSRMAFNQCPCNIARTGKSHLSVLIIKIEKKWLSKKIQNIKQNGFHFFSFNVYEGSTLKIKCPFGFTFPGEKLKKKLG